MFSPQVPRHYFICLSKFVEIVYFFTQYPKNIKISGAQAYLQKFNGNVRGIFNFLLLISSNISLCYNAIEMKRRFKMTCVDKS